MKLLSTSSVLAAVFLAGCATTTETTTAPPEESSGTSAEDTCIAAVSQQTGVSDVKLLTQNAYSGGTLVSVTVAGAEAPWACQVGANGTLESVYYTAEG